MAADLPQVAPPVFISGLTVAGVGLDEFVLILTAIYTLLMIVKNVKPAYVAFKNLVRKLKRT